MIEQGRRRDQDMQVWFEKLINEFRGKRVRFTGTYGDLTRMAMYAAAKGVKCEFGPGSFLMGGGGMKGFKDAPDNWKELIRDFLGIDKMLSVHGMSECMGTAPLCSQGHFHFMPYAIPILLDKDAEMLPREGVQTGHLALFDLLAEIGAASSPATKSSFTGTRTAPAAGRVPISRTTSRALRRWRAATTKSPVRARRRRTMTSWTS